MREYLGSAPIFPQALWRFGTLAHTTNPITPQGRTRWQAQTPSNW